VGLAAVHAELGERDYLRGRQVRTDAGLGVAAGIDDAGRLLVRTDGGTVAVASGEIDLVS
jgi:biotin-(acetyl-CoA carboxylase) ligase